MCHLWHHAILGLWAVWSVCQVSKQSLKVMRWLTGNQANCVRCVLGVLRFMKRHLLTVLVADVRESFPTWIDVVYEKLVYLQVWPLLDMLASRFHQCWFLFTVDGGCMSCRWTRYNSGIDDTDTCVVQLLLLLFYGLTYRLQCSDVDELLCVNRTVMC